jgi:hypothetical protein
VREAIQKLVEKENTDLRKVVREEKKRTDEASSPYNSSTWMMIITQLNYLLKDTKKLQFCNHRFGHVRWVPCYHSMARPKVADGGNDLQIWSVAANILNKQSRTTNKGWSSSLRVGCGAKNSSP